MSDNDNVYYLFQESERARRLSPGAQLMEWLRDAEVTPAEPVGEQEITESPGDPPPRFPTGLPGWDEKTAGGGYGCTCIAGAPKCGKSMLALSCAVESARDDVPWRVLYFDAELSRYEMINRLRRYLGGPPNQALADQLSFHPTGLGVTPAHVFLSVGDRIRLEDTHLLLIFDSLNRIVKQSQTSFSDAGYWGTMQRWIELCRMASMLSGGRIASVVVSELAGAGHVKGRDIEYAADLVLKITPDNQEEYFNLSIPYARSSAGGKLGAHYLDWRHGRFECIESYKRTETDLSDMPPEDRDNSPSSGWW